MVTDPGDVCERLGLKSVFSEVLTLSDSAASEADVWLSRLIRCSNSSPRRGGGAAPEVGKLSCVTSPRYPGIGLEMLELKEHGKGSSKRLAFKLVSWSHPGTGSICLF